MNFEMSLILTSSDIGVYKIQRVNCDVMRSTEKLLPSLVLTNTHLKVDICWIGHQMCNLEMVVLILVSLVEMKKQVVW